MMKNKHMALMLTLLLGGGLVSGNAGQIAAQTVSERTERDFAKAVEAFDNGMYERAMTLFDDIVFHTGSVKAEGYSVLCQVKTGARGWENRMESFVSAHPSSELVPQLKFALACKMFASGDYKNCVDVMNELNIKHLRRSQYSRFDFIYGFALFSTGEYVKAAEHMQEILSRRKSGYTAPAAYTLGYIEYEDAEYQKAEGHFAMASGDSRFAELASYYILECRFLGKDYSYVIENGPALYETVPEDRKQRLGRILGEAYLIDGQPEKAEKYYNSQSDNGVGKSRTDLFFTGSMLYASKDYKGAAENFAAMENRTDSLGQIANYQLGWAYLQCGNKVSALESFREASLGKWDDNIARDALFNSAKLSFDINADARQFKYYLNRYPQARSQEIYGYIALAALYGKDWQSAVDAYDNVDDLTPEMERNYVKANYLRARQLISAGAVRDAVPLLRTVTFYSERNSALNQLARYWLAEVQYRNSDYQDALVLYKELYHTSAFSGSAEGKLIPYNIAYCHFRRGELDQAAKWFDEFLTSSGTDKDIARKDALTRIADCFFLNDNYIAAADKYSEVARIYFDPDDVYPYLQAGMAYGLAGRKNEKTQALEEVKLAKPDVGDYSTAMIELGRCYVDSGNTSLAGECFDRVINSVGDSTAVAQALLEKALLERNANNTENSLRLYKRVAENMAGSEYADNALLAIENICRSEGLTDDYMAYMAKLGKGESKSVTEKEDFYFSSAQQLYFDARYDKALGAMQNYIERYPEGRYVIDAKYCVAECLRVAGQYEKACDVYEEVIESGASDYSFPAMQKFADLSYSLEKYKVAYMAYTSILNEQSLNDAMRFSCMTGRMRAAFKAKLFEEAADVAAQVEKSESCGDDLKREALYVQAKSLLSLSRREEALPLFGSLAENPLDAIGAEARYQLIRDRFDRAEYAKVEEMVYAFAESGTTQNRFVAASFIILGDSFAERGQMLQAKATFESIRDGYTPESETDDILEQVNLRLYRIGKME
ncbi:MAG: tetratricopeptide repeat protein [Rikenellaceae bacterium]|nr:tetratricopeptide repeat protein [Rikenellaceae bacterium]